MWIPTAFELEEGDKIRLLSAKSLSAEGVTGDFRSLVLAGTTIHYTLEQEILKGDYKSDGELNLVVKDVSAAPQAKTLLEGSLAASALVNQGADMVAGRGIQAAMSAVEEAEFTFTPFAAIQGGSMRYNTGSHIDMQSLNLMAGLPPVPTRLPATLPSAPSSNTAPVPTTPTTPSTPVP